MNLEDLSLKDLVVLNKMIEHLGRERATKITIKWHGGVDQLSEADILPLENMYKVLHSQYKNVEELYRPYENEPIANLIGIANMNKVLRSPTKTYEELFGSRESLSESEIAFAEREREERVKGYNSKPIEQHHGPMEDMSISDQDQLAASNRAVNIEQNSKAGRYDSSVGGTIEDASISDQDQLAASNRAVNIDQNSKAGRYDSGIGGTIEDAIAGGDSLNDKKAARAEQIKTSKEHVEKLQDLLKNPHNFNAVSFKKAVLRGLEDNQILKDFMSRFRELVSEQTELIANTPKTPEEIEERNKNLSVKLCNSSAEAASLSPEIIRKRAKANLEAYLNIYAHLRHYIVEYNGVIDESYVNLSNDEISRIFDAQKALGRDKVSQLIMMPTPLKKNSKYDVGDFLSPAVTALYSLDPGMRKFGAGLDIQNDIYKNPKSPRWQKEDGVEVGI